MRDWNKFFETVKIPRTNQIRIEKRTQMDFFFIEAYSERQIAGILQIKKPK